MSQLYEYDPSPAALPLTVTQSFYSNDLFAIELEIDIGDPEPVYGVGIAKRHPIDKPDLQIGFALAYGRAYEQLARKLIKRANGRVKHAEDMTLYKQQQKSKPTGYKPKNTARMK